MDAVLAGQTTPGAILPDGGAECNGHCRPAARSKTSLDIFHNKNIISSMPLVSATSDIFNAIADPRRRQIIDLLARRRGLPVGTIVLTLELPQPAVSKHLGVLREVGIVTVKKVGKSRIYDLNLDQLRTVQDWVQSLEKHWERQLDRIRARGEQRASRSSSTPD
jgi:DNA-binding transcriptional ArsR family regulator